MSAAGDSADARHVAWTERRYDERRAEIAASLRRLADDFERESEPRENAVHSPRFGWRAQSGVHAVMWGLANLNLDGFVLAAAEADAAAHGVSG